MGFPLLVAGFSTRAAAQSARRAGFQVLAVDAFGDRDLLATAAEVGVASDYPAGIPDACARLPAAPWMYTGGLENEPEIITAVSRERQLLGNGPDVLALVRDPLEIARKLAEARLDTPIPVGFPEMQLDPPADDGRWLWKRFKSCGGLGIQSYRRESAARLPRGEGYYQRERFASVPVGAAFVAAQGQAICFGHSSGILGKQWGASSATQYVGSIAFTQVLWPGAEETMRTLGNWIAREFGLTGLFGLDLVIAEGQFWLLEVNPRYCASFELLERGWGLPLLQWHYDACLHGRLPHVPLHDPGAPVQGKLIVYAPHDCRVGPAFEALVLRSNDSDWPLIADLPAPNATIQRGQPIVTIFASAPFPDESHALHLALAHLRSALLATLEAV